MPKNLVIVESPAKGKTIEKYLGSHFSVKSSFGHIRDLPKKGLAIDKDHNFKPTYEIPEDKIKVVNELKKAVKAADEVWLASDEDREGEAIAWHLCEALGLNPKNTKRIVFHEITKTAIEAAIANPRTVDINLVDAQQARRILDRLVGYELSPVLWKKVRGGLSAGRVQSVAVRLVVEREREIKDFATETSFKVTAEFKASGHNLPAELETKPDSATKAKNLLDKCKGANYTVSSVDTKPGSRSPGPPFTTSSLQQEAARRLGYSVKQTMTLAQRLYESGHITYMRTDSTHLSDLALKSAQDYIVKEYGQQYYTSRQYQTKTAGAQEAHEAIRPSHFKRTEAGHDAQQKKLYQLIWKRALASQMAPAAVERTEARIAVSTIEEAFIAKGEVLKFDGYFKVYGGSKDDVILPKLSVGQELDLVLMQATESLSRAPARYSEASLVKKLEELGIGRPSTYAPTISTIQSRGYVANGDVEGENRKFKQFTLEKNKLSEAEIDAVVGADRGKLIPTSLADITTDFLMKYFKEIMDYDFTAHVEEDFDAIADGKETWQKMIANFYKDFHPLIGKSDKASREETSQARHLGKDPKTGKPILARYGKYGPMLQRGSTEEEEKPDFAPLPDDSTLETVTLTQALEMFKLPRLVGKTDEGEEIKANIGRFGPYIQVGKLFVSIKPLDPFKITHAEALKLYKEKLEQNANKYIAEFKGGIKVVNGPYGPYVTDGKKNAKIPEGKKPEKLTEADCKEILANAPEKKRFFRKAKTATK